VAEPVVVLETEVELVMVREAATVKELRGDTLQHPLLEGVTVKLGESQALPVEVPRAEDVSCPVAGGEVVTESLAEEVTEATRVARAVAEPEPVTVAVLGGKTEFVPVVELVVVFETLMLRVCVGEPVEVRESARLTVLFADSVDVFVPREERVFVLEPRGVTVTVGVEVSVREARVVAVSDGEPLDVLEGAKVLVPVRLTPTVRVKGGE